MLARSLSTVTSSARVPSRRAGGCVSARPAVPCAPCLPACRCPTHLQWHVRSATRRFACCATRSGVHQGTDARMWQPSSRSCESCVCSATGRSLRADPCTCWPTVSRFAKLAKSKGFRQCPHCKVWIDRAQDGCAQMRCVVCDHMFCWHCGANVDVRVLHACVSPALLSLVFPHPHHVGHSMTCLPATGTLALARACSATHARKCTATESRLSACFSGALF